MNVNEYIYFFWKKWLKLGEGIKSKENTHIYTYIYIYDMIDKCKGKWKKGIVYLQMIMWNKL